MRLPAINPLKLLSEPVECRLTYAKYSEDPEILRALCNDPFWFVRDYAASNRYTPEECLLKLLEDPDFRIQGEAQRNLNKRAQGSVKPALAQQVHSAEARQTVTSSPGDHIVPKFER